MSASSVYAQIAATLAATGLLRTTVRADESPLNEPNAILLSPAQTPGVIITRGRSQEKAFSNMSSLDETPYTCAVWLYGSNPQSDGPAFDDLVESLRQALRQARQLGGLADTPTTKVLWTQVATSEPLPRPFAVSGTEVAYNEAITLVVREEIFA